MLIWTQFNIGDKILHEAIEDKEYRGEFTGEIIGIHLDKTKTTTYSIKSDENGKIFIFKENDLTLVNVVQEGHPTEGR